MKIIENTVLFEFVVAKLKLRRSPQQICLALRREFPEEPRMWLGAESILSAIHPRRPHVSRAVQCTANVPSHPEIAMTPGKPKRRIGLIFEHCPNTDLRISTQPQLKDALIKRPLSVEGSLVAVCVTLARLDAGQ